MILIFDFIKVSSSPTVLRHLSLWVCSYRCAVIVMVSVL